MFETGIRQFRMALGMVWGRKLDTANLARLVNDALATIAEFGEPGADVGALIDGPFADPEARREFADRALRRTARRLADRSPFYARRFAAAGVDPDRFDQEMLRTIPVTVKRDLVDRQADFQCSGVAPHLSTRTTGTTGRPAEIWMSRYELELWSGLSALSCILRDEIRPTDLMQVNTSSRATAAVHLNTAVCRLAGARSRLLGVIPPDESLDSLIDGGVTLLAAPPSYLAELVTAARRRGTSPSDFRLRRIDVGGEVLTSTLREAAQQTFGGPRLNDVFGMTEVIPVSASTCSQGHLHHDINMGMVEVLGLETGAPAGPGEPGTVVITPYFPYRECMPVFRYDTRDVVYRLPDAELTCEVAGVPATSAIVGKADHLLRLGDELVTPRALAEAVESLPSQPLPARFRAQVVDGRLQLTLPVAALTGLSEPEVLDHFAARGLDVHLSVVDDDQAQSLRPLRSDLHETTFVGRPA
ncbi:MAG TPA: AMP-binding protein [Jatrophihabitans sp.]|nr:AMP-binding protein [Jatrophihabitans sp.]